MTNRTPRPSTGDQERAGPASEISIPDGGLGSAMPEWMRQTPSWRRAPEQPAPRSLPEPDTSIIDPRRLIDVADLPDWLQAVAARNVHERSYVSLAPDRDRASSFPSGGEAKRPEPSEAQAAGQGWPAPPDAAAQAPAERSQVSDQQHVRLTPSPPPIPRPWWMSDVAVAVLFVAIVLTLIYVVLAASGVA